MEHAEARELTAAYALDALDEVEERSYEEHLRGCAECREELSLLSEAAASLAYAAEGPAPPPLLRERILTQARGERGNVVQLRPRRTGVVLTSLAAAAAAVLALGVGLWARSLSESLDRERQATEILADPQAERVPLEGAPGQLVVDRDGRAALVVERLERAPSGKTYELWVIERGAPPRPAGLFEGEEARDVVLLRERVPRGSEVAVTLEPAGGVDAPTTRPLLSARA